MRRSPFALAATKAALVSSAGMLATSGVARAAPLAQGAEAGRADGGTAARAADLPATATHRILWLEGALAVRANRIASPGFDAFSSSDALVESTLAASYWFARTRRPVSRPVSNGATAPSPPARAAPRRRSTSTASR